MICKQESAVVYRMNTPMGEGIMHWYSIADGIDYVYSEIETYYPRYQEQKKLVNYIEIMYMAEGIVFIDHAVQYLNDFFPQMNLLLKISTRKFGKLRAVPAFRPMSALKICLKI